MDQGDHDLKSMKENGQECAPLTEALRKFVNRRPVYFCIPGHRFDVGIPEDLDGSCGGNIINFDLTEAPGLDDLHNAKGVLKEAQELLSEAYGSTFSRFLVNGTTCGIEAAILSAVPEGEKILLPRNAHRSVLSGLVLGGAVPVWMPPVTDGRFGFPTSVNPDTVREKLENDYEIRAALIVSPTYYGSFSDIRKIAEICHSRQIPLIVDEAHGAHLYFSDLKECCAIPCGADVSVMSAHKTLGAFGQSSYLHLNSRLIPVERIDSALKMLMSSSPSYMLMASLDSARRQAVLNGTAFYEKACGIAERIREGAKNAGYPAYEGPKHDPARVVLSAEAAGMSGTELAELLFERYNIAVEMADRLNIVLVVTAANERNDAETLISALRDLKKEDRERNPVTPFSIAGDLFSTIPEVRCSPREAYFARKKTVLLEEAAGYAAGEEVVVYPPGCALLYPGEVIHEQFIDTVRSCQAAGLTLQRGTSNDADTISVMI